MQTLNRQPSCLVAHSLQQRPALLGAALRGAVVSAGPVPCGPAPRQPAPQSHKGQLLRSPGRSGNRVSAQAAKKGEVPYEALMHAAEAAARKAETVSALLL